MKIVVRENENKTPEYVLQAKKEGSGRSKKDEDKGTSSIEPENVIVNETGAHPSNSTYLATTKLLVQNYTEQPKTEQGKKNLNTIRQLQAQRQNEALSNGAKLTDKAGRRVEPYFYVPTPDVRFDGFNRFTLTTVSVPHLTRPEIDLCGHLSNLHLISPELIELLFIRLHANAPPPCICKTENYQ